VYSFDSNDFCGPHDKNQDKQPLVANTIRCALQFLSHVTPEELRRQLTNGLLIQLNADGAFYSGRGKTGLGSSAALVAALSTALLTLCGWITAPSPSSSAIDASATTDIVQRSRLDSAHRLAQFAHAAGQSLIGSGFDVAAAFYGCCVFHRADAALLEPIYKLQKQAGGVPLRELERLATSQSYQPKIEQFALPVGLALMLLDVGGGSSTRDMVQKVRAYVASGHEPGPMADLKSANKRMAELFLQLADCAPSDTASAFSKCTSSDHAQWNTFGSVGSILQRIHSTCVQEQRVAIRAVGKASGADIEPVMQTRRLDALLALRGVVCAAVPGAGGTDAIFVLALAPQGVTNVSALVSRGENVFNGVSVTSVHAGSGGITLQSYL